MDNPITNIVWLKRDIRSQDHEPLFRAEQAGVPYHIIYLFEPTLIAHPDTSLRHLQFVYQSILDLNAVLQPFRAEVSVFYGEAVAVFRYLHKHFALNTLFSYRESGPQSTWERDKAVAAFCKTHNIKWRQSQRDGVLRGLANRDNWIKQWYTTMQQPVWQNQYTAVAPEALQHPFALPKALKSQLNHYPDCYQPAGERKAWRYLRSFTAQRGFNYHKHISKPAESRMSCSRLSPYLAWGNLSIRQVFQYVKTHPNRATNGRAFSTMLTRLRWHCHFIQKFEVACSYETQCINKGYELLHRDRNKAFIKAWKTGMTGYPLVDACMRAVIHTGWINFRMRAMLVSFLTLNLDQDWRDGVYHLAQQFLDYEPGIHYPQFQMQAGTTGINTVRLYNPVKNAREHDSEGVFVRRWIPELAKVPLNHLYEPWQMTAMEQTFCGVRIGVDYPAPIVDLQESARAARIKIWGHRKHPLVQEERKRILAIHVNKKK